MKIGFPFSLDVLYEGFLALTLKGDGAFALSSLGAESNQWMGSLPAFSPRPPHSGYPVIPYISGAHKEWS